MSIVKLTFFALITFLATSCSSDISVVDKSETRVVVDSFVQADQMGELDVLVVLDTSGSMSDNYDDVSGGMEILRSDIETLTLDYQFGYITMDPTRLGYLGPYDSSSTQIDMLMAPSLLPTTSLEEGFAATYGFISSEEGLYFKRPEADLLLFLISDENEQSAITSDLFYDWLHDEFREVRHDVVTITQLEGSECGYTYDVGHKYEELALMYGKNPIDICEEDWSVWLSDSSYLTQRKDFIILSENDPILESIVVYVNQIAIYDWEYIEDGNLIQLGFVPDYGAVVEAGYNVEAH
mgnify:CR=1 FL=1|jgi:hypothetical protein|tara:strand:- start:8764 stop:9648 length:885 start_codon:yes stop_codon:yes gene_type:complete